jgi:hypothetical protein
LPNSFLERTALDFGAPENIKLVTGIRLRIVGNTGETVNISVAGLADTYESPNYTQTIPYVIGQTLKADLFVSGRYIAIKISGGSAYLWRIDSYDVDVEVVGEY